jgi:hypothetical protein
LPNALNQQAETRKASGFTLLLLCLFPSTESNERCTPRLLRRHAAPEVFFDRKLDVRSHFGFKVAIDIRVRK